MAELWFAVVTARGKTERIVPKESKAERLATRMAKQRGYSVYVVPVYVSPVARESARVPSLPDPLAQPLSQGPPAEFLRELPISAGDRIIKANRA